MVTPTQEVAIFEVEFLFVRLLQFGVTCCHSQLWTVTILSKDGLRPVTILSRLGSARAQWQFHKKKPYPQKLAEHHNQQHLFPICSVAEGWVLHLVGKKYSLLYL